MPRPTDEERFISRVPEDGSSIGNKALRDWLGWDEDKYHRVRDRLVEKRVIVRAQGYGGPVKLAPEEAEAAELPEQVSENRQTTRGRGKLSDEAKFLSLMPEDGARVSNRNLREQLGWAEDKYSQIRDRLVESGAIARGPGGGGGTVRQIEAEEEAFLAQVPADGSDITNKRVMEILEWDDERFSRVREQLLGKELIVIPSSRGKHLCIQRATPEDAAPEQVGVPEEDEGLDSSEDASEDAQGIRGRGKLNEEAKILSLMPEDGATIGNRNLREQLGWNEDKYCRIRDRLVENGVIALGPGPGGTVRRIDIDKKSFLALLPADGSDITNKRVMDTLEWDEARFARVRDRLVKEGVVVVPSGRGKHLCVQRVMAQKAAPEPIQVKRPEAAPERISVRRAMGTPIEEYEHQSGREQTTPKPGQVQRESKAQKRPRVFIGSSSEGLKFAKAIQLNLEHLADCTIWSQGVFGLSRGTLEELVRVAKNFDYAILVLTPDDVTEKRGVVGNSPRDNVLFELGLFMGALGREHTFMVCDRDAAVVLPTDLAGVTPATFFGNRPDKNWPAALGPVCTKIETEMGL